MTSISAVIPAYNAETCIAKAIESVLQQTIPMDQIIVVDDGSTDRTAEIASSFPVTVLRQQNQGVSAARNAGITASSCEWIALLDADDTWMPHKTGVQIQFIQSDVGVIYSNEAESVTFDRLWKERIAVTPSGAIVRRQVFDETGLFDIRLQGTEDRNMWQRISMTKWRFVNAGLGLFRYTPTPNSLSLNEIKMAADELRNVEIVGDQFGLSDIEERKEWVRLEYARNLIAASDPAAALGLLRECRKTAASRWLRLASHKHLKRLARKDILHLLVT